MCWCNIDSQAGRRKSDLTFQSGAFPRGFIRVLTVCLTRMLNAAAGVVGSRWLVLCGFPGSSAGRAPEAPMSRVACLVVDSVPWFQPWYWNFTFVLLSSANSAHNNSHTNYGWIERGRWRKHCKKKVELPIQRAGNEYINRGKFFCC